MISEDSYLILPDENTSELRDSFPYHQEMCAARAENKASKLRIDVRLFINSFTLSPFRDGRKNERQKIAKY